jgi:acyl carrier protein
MKKTLLNIIIEIAQNKNLNNSSQLNEVDLDSIDMLDLLSRINKEFGYDISIDEYQSCNTISDLENMIKKI